MDEETRDKSAAPGPMGATTDLPHDRMTVALFRETFPRARWSDSLNAWFVPGRTAQKRISRWLAEMEAGADRFADDKGRDAFAFEPIESRYLEAAPAALEIRTPYSRSVIDEIRETPYARWDADRRLWTLPIARSTRSGSDGRRSRQPRREVIKGSKEEEAFKARTRERRRKRYPVPSDACLPALRARDRHARRIGRPRHHPCILISPRWRAKNTSGRRVGRAHWRNW
jgi:hypothetical protein